MAEHFKINPGRAEDARRIVELEAEAERLRLQVVALENAGMETAAQLGEAEEEIARLRRLASDDA